MPRKTTKKPTKTTKTTTGEVKLLSGGNPQIAKADGDAPVQAYIAAMPEWKSDLGRRLDDLIVRNVPNVRKAVRWNTASRARVGSRATNGYVKITFLNGARSTPSRPAEARTPTRAGSTSMKANSTRSRWRSGSASRHALPGWDGLGSGDTL